MGDRDVVLFVWRCSLAHSAIEFLMQVFACDSTIASREGNQLLTQLINGVQGTGPKVQGSGFRAQGCEGQRGRAPVAQATVSRIC